MQSAIKENTTNLCRFVCWLIVLLLFVPKVNILEVDGFRAGIRIDDVVIFVCVSFLIVSQNLAALIRNPVFQLASAFVFISAVGNLIMGGTFLFTLRMLEYLAVIVPGYLLFNNHSSQNGLEKILFVYLCLSAVICVFQSLGLISGVGIVGLTNEFGGRVIGLCNGAWELGITVCMVLAYLIWSPFCWFNNRLTWVVAVLSLISVGLSASRTPMLILTVVILLRIMHSYGLILKILMLVLFSFLVYCAIILLDQFDVKGVYVLERMKDVLNNDSFDELVYYARTFDLSTDYSKLDVEIYSSTNVDMSMAIRFAIFGNLISSYINGGLLTWILGLGHGWAGPSTDMGVVRILAETGILGFGLFHLMLRRVALISQSLKYVVFAILINQLTLDAYIGYKTMFIFYLIVGNQIRRSCSPKIQYA